MAHATPQFDALVEKLMGKWHIPGLAIAVIHKDEVHTKGYGHANLSKEKVTPDTLFDCASTSKSFTAACVSMLVDDNEKYPDIKWDTPVSKLLPDDFVLADPKYTEDVTVEDILSHRSGMPRHDLSYFGINAANPDNAKTITRNLRNLPLTKPLRTAEQYCNIMYTAASYLVETKSGVPYPQFLKERIFDPLEMTNTYHDIEGVEAAKATDKLSHAYRWDKKTESYEDIPLFNQPEGQGAGCIYSCANDYAKYIRMMIKRGSPLSADAHKELVKPRTISLGDEEDELPFHSQDLYALGWETQSYRGHRVIGHNGGVSGFKSLMRFLPKHEWGFVLLANANDGIEVADILKNHLVDELLGVPQSDRVDFDTFFRDQQKKWDQENAEFDPFPDRPNPPLPLSAPLEKYAGTYYNVGYGDIALKIVDGRLFADCTDRCSRFEISLKHVSQDSFVAEVVYVLDGDYPDKLKSGFRLDDKGEVKAFGIEFAKLPNDDFIWFDKK